MDFVLVEGTILAETTVVEVWGRFLEAMGSSGGFLVRGLLFPLLLNVLIYVILVLIVVLLSLELLLVDVVEFLQALVVLLEVVVLLFEILVQLSVNVGTLLEQIFKNLLPFSTIT